jgi:hypothetical protein
VAITHFSDKTLLMYAGVTIPPPNPQEQQIAAHAMAMGVPAPPTAGQQIQQMVAPILKLLRDEKLRCANFGIETDSTILPDEEKERQDRLMFLGQIGAFLQQAGPMVMQFPDIRGLMGALMMFAVRSFRGARPLEKEFEVFTAKLMQQPPSDPNGGKDNGQAAAQASVQSAQIKAQSDQQNAAQDIQMKKYQVDQQEATSRQKNQNDHEYRMRQLDLDQQRLQIDRIRFGAELEDGERDRADQDRARQDELAQKAHENTAQSVNDSFAKVMQAHEQHVAEQTIMSDAAMANRKQDMAEQGQADQADIADRQQTLAENPPSPEEGQ